MKMQRPDLSGIPPEVAAYIEGLEQELGRLRETGKRGAAAEPADNDPSEPPTTINIVTVTQNGLIKRTPRHLYARQRRGGMGVFGLEGADDDPPGWLAAADETAGVTIVTDQGRAFRLAVSDLPEVALHSRGAPLRDRMPLRADEAVALVFADAPAEGRGAYLAVVTRRGQVRRIGSQYLGKNLQPGTVLLNVSEGGPPAAACWTSGTDDLFVVTRAGQAIRFAERLVPVRGCLGMRIDPADIAVGIAAAKEAGGVFLLGADGKGTIRLLSGFAANKSPGAGGKIAMKAEQIAGAATVREQDDILIISRLGKVIRFSAAEVPPKEGVVQGVICMNLRADECAAMTVLRL